ncbi:asparaginase [Epibacterium sp. SM1969]|uniref:Asparaginase n=1 Tax=Tritonibacter aquimaris TaxID=2663379 RepID=A0A844B0Y4_9RHOB|nr:asparaginase domain-containing protein [Tritonibacter aquimaris]MQY44204.1 asparaginase [Tritonibacter aquimaris]
MTICVIHTGGTIGCAATPTGFALCDGLVETALAELAQSGNVQPGYEMVLADPLIDSSQARVADWNWIAGEIASRHDSFDGFVVIHGTDSMAFSAAALAFALEGLEKPVVLTGSMVPLSVEVNDGRGNLVAAMAAAQSATPGVWLQFAGQLLPGTRVQKRHSTAWDAFGADRQDVAPRAAADRFQCHSYAAKRIAVMTMTPGFDPQLLVDLNADAVILRCLGTGNVPGDAEFVAALQGLKARNMPTLVISQCLEGGIVMGTYSAALPLVQADVIDGRDLTLEAGYAKLMMALSRFETDAVALRAYMTAALAGEISPLP